MENIEIKETYHRIVLRAIEEDEGNEGIWADISQETFNKMIYEHETDGYSNWYEATCLNDCVTQDIAYGETIMVRMIEDHVIEAKAKKMPSEDIHIQINKIIDLVRNEDNIVTIETDNNKFERLVDFGTIDGNNICVLCFEGHRFALLVLEDVSHIENCENIFNIFSNELNDKPEYTIKVN